MAKNPEDYKYSDFEKIVRYFRKQKELSTIGPIDITRGKAVEFRLLTAPKKPEHDPRKLDKLANKIYRENRDGARVTSLCEDGGDRTYYPSIEFTGLIAIVTLKGEQQTKIYDPKSAYAQGIDTSGTQVINQTDILTNLLILGLFPSQELMGEYYHNAFTHLNTLRESGGSNRIWVAKPTIQVPSRTRGN